jgi:NitT/TauT family transport system substrate-binding protein
MNTGGQMKRTSIAAVVLVLAVVLVAACGSDGSSEGSTATTAGTATSAADGDAEPSSGPDTPAPQPLGEQTKVTVALAANGVEAYSQALLAEKFGEFEKENLQVELQVLPLPEIVGLLQSGQVDVAPAGANIPILNAIAAGIDVAVVAAMPTFPPAPDSKAGFWVTPDLVDSSGELDPCDMKGRTVSFGGPAGLGSAATLPFANFVEQCDLTINDVTVSVVGGPDALIALQNGSIDAAYLPDPLWADADAKGYAEFAIPFGQDTVGGYVMGPLRTEKPEVADAIIRALVRTTRTYLQGDYRNDPEVRPALEEVLGVGGAVLDVGSPLIFDPDMRFDPVIVEPIQKVWIEAGDLLSYDEPLPVTDIVDESNLDRVLAG